VASAISVAPAVEAHDAAVAQILLEKAGKCSKSSHHVQATMSVLEIVAEKHLGQRTLQAHPKLRAALKRLEGSAALESERERTAAIVELCFEFDRETDREEKKNILRTLEEISANKSLELPSESIDDWEGKLKATDRNYAKADSVVEKRTNDFLKKYFSFRAKAGLATQADVARKSGLSRSYVAVIESGEHMPQQKTLQKLAAAFGVDVAELIR
jgi:DNA-binding XRE family transcriptional regulator